ncbi:MAG TPA: C40 family peptidase, partial [Rhodothermales bacterium]|nr:C40 family peptidase [Rhodothermales bacterium]
WLAALRTDPEALVSTAKTLLGAPYLWGGTSTKGMDCSGFTKTVYLLHGLILPRDANQQADAGEAVDDAGDFSKLQPGDLLFFGRKAQEGRAESIVHVGMWIGGGEFIHAAGRVRINSMDPGAPNYDAYERGRYIRARRYLGTPQGVALLREGGLYARPGSE